MIVFSICVTLLIFSACFSSYETSFYSLERKQSAHQKTRPLFFSLNVILIGNSSVRVLFSEIGGYSLEQFLKEHWGIYGAQSHLLVIFTVALILIIFGESIPLNFGMAYPSFVQKTLGWFIALVSIIFYPLAKPLSVFLDKMIHFLQKKNQAATQGTMTEEEVRSIIQLSYEREVVNPHEKQLTDAVITLYSQTVSFYMIPRRDILSVDLSDSLSLAWNKMKNASATKILIQQDTIDNVVGYIGMEDMSIIEHIQTTPALVSSLGERIQPHIVIPESKKLIDAIEILRQNRRALGVVIDEYGGLEGVVTMNQLLGELLVFDKGGDFGIRNSGPLKEGGMIEPKDDGILVNALRTTLRMVLEYFEQELEWVPEEEWSVGRLILKKLDRFPKEEEELQIKNLYFRIVRMHNRAIQKVFISLIEGEEPGNRSKGIYYDV